MRARAAVVVLLTLALVLSGCLNLQGQGEDLEGQGLDEVARDTATLAWTSGSSASARTFTRNITVPDGAGALFVDFHATVLDEGDVRVRAEAPSGDSVLVGVVARGEATRWQVLPPIPGTWVVTGVANGTTQGQLNVTVLPDAPDPIPVRGNGTDRVVVAVVDTGVNPYHDVFQRPGLTTGTLPGYLVDAETGAPPLRLEVAQQASYVASVREDAARWVDAPGGTLVHFNGTNLLGYELDDTAAPHLPVLDRAGHGTSVAHSVVREHPDALVVMVTGSDWDAGVRWAASQPWIDLVSLSWGPAVNLAGVAEPHVFGFTTATATREATDAGKVVFTATGNDPTPAFTDTTSGPPWVHAVSGAHPDTRSRAFLSGNLVDTVADWTQDLARYDGTSATWNVSGTSFATPTTAGVAARILHEVRVAAGHEGGIVDEKLVDAGGVTVTNGDLRDALNATAIWWNATDYGGPQDPGPSIPVAPAAPWVSMGWGYVNGSIVPRAVAGLLGEDPLPEKSAAAHAWMEGNLELRAQYWAIR